MTSLLGIANYGSSAYTKGIHIIKYYFVRVIYICLSRSIITNVGGCIVRIHLLILAYLFGSLVIH